MDTYRKALVYSPQIGYKKSYSPRGLYTRVFSSRKFDSQKYLIATRALKSNPFIERLVPGTSQTYTNILRCIFPWKSYGKENWVEVTYRHDSGVQTDKEIQQSTKDKEENKPNSKPNFVSKQPKFPTLFNMPPKPCAFYGGNHFNASCPKFCTRKDRKEVLIRDKKMFPMPVARSSDRRM